MGEKRDKPPSRKRYEESNPNWTVRMALPWHKDYEIHVEKFGLCRREFMGISLEKIKLNYEQVRAQAYNEGFQVGHKQGHQEGYAEGENIGYSKGREDGFAEGKHVGINQGKNDYQIWYYCSICGGPLYVKSGSMEHRAIMEYLYSYGWSHPQCAERRFYW